jgi:AcrR family transcriptional regulator
MPKPHMAKASTSDARDAPSRTRNRKRTLEELNQALSRLQRNGRKITLKAVADEAGVSAPLLNNRYPDFAEQVRAIIGKSVRQQRNKKADLLTQEREKNRELRELNKSQLSEITKLASINEALRAEIVLCKAIAENKVIRGDFGRQR